MVGLGTGRAMDHGSAIQRLGVRVPRLTIQFSDACGIRTDFVY